MIQNEKIFADYRIFFSTKQNHYILACTISEIAGHEMFFKISEEEYCYIVNDKKHLDRIAYGCAVLRASSPRFLGSQNMVHNHTDSQKAFTAELTAELLATKKEF